MESVCTKNDVEGWHLGLNRRAYGKSQIPLCLLINLLHKEAQLTSVQIRLVSEKKLKRIQRKKYRNLQSKLFHSRMNLMKDKEAVKGMCAPEWPNHLTMYSLNFRVDFPFNEKS